MPYRVDDTVISRIILDSIYFAVISAVNLYRVDATVTECASPYSTPGLAETGRQVPILPSVPRSQEGRARRHVRFAFFLGLSAVSPVSQLIEIGFSRLMPRMTMARTIKLYKLPDTPQV